MIEENNSRRSLGCCSIVYLDFNKLTNWLTADWTLIGLKPQLFGTIAAHTLKTGGADISQKTTKTYSMRKIYDQL